MKINYKIKRLKLILLGITSISLAVFFILKALNEQIVFFYSPSELKKKNIEEKEIIRVGGLVLEESIKYSSEGLNINFIITDKKNIVNVIYKGVLPDLFREGQGVVAEGKFKENIFVANRVLAKHDENYMPPEVKKALE